MKDRNLALTCETPAKLRVSMLCPFPDKFFIWPKEEEQSDYINIKALKSTVSESSPKSIHQLLLALLRPGRSPWQSPSAPPDVRR